MKYQFKTHMPLLALGMLSGLLVIVGAELLRPKNAEPGVPLADIPFTNCRSVRTMPASRDRSGPPGCKQRTAG